MYIDNNANNVVIDVIIVLAKVSLIDKLATSLILIFVYFNKFSYSIINNYCVIHRIIT